MKNAELVSQHRTALTVGAKTQEINYTSEEIAELISSVLDAKLPTSPNVEPVRQAKRPRTSIQARGFFGNVVDFKLSIDDTEIETRKLSIALEKSYLTFGSGRSLAQEFRP